MIGALREDNEGFVGVRLAFYVRGDDDDVWYGVGVTYSPATGYFFVVGPVGTELPDSKTINVSDRLVGSAFYIRDSAKVWHDFIIELDEGGDYTWTHLSTSTSEPAVQRILDKVRCDDGLYVADVDGAFIHKMGIRGGAWTELARGFTVPMETTPIPVLGPFCTVSGTGFLDPAGNALVAVGTNAGGWLCHESAWWGGDNLAGTGSPGPVQNEDTITAHIDASHAVGHSIVTGAQFFTDIRTASLGEDDIAAMAALGANLLRVPIHWALVADGRAFTYLDSLLGWARTHGVYLMPDMHTAPGCANAAAFCSAAQTANLWTDPANMDYLLSLWAVLAARYAAEPQIFAWDVLNEPSPGGGVPLTDADLKSRYLEIHAAIRAVDPGHILIFEGNSHAGGSTVFNSGGAWLPALDSNAAYSFHVYTGENSNASVATIKGDINNWAAANIAPVVSHGVPITVGEFGYNFSNGLTAATQVFQESSVPITSACYFPYHGISSDGTDSGTKILRNHGTSAGDSATKAKWTTLTGHIHFGTSYTQQEYDDAMSVLPFANFHYRTAYHDTLAAYFAAPFG